MLVFVDDLQKFLHGPNVRRRFVAVPLQIGALPEYSPRRGSPNKRGFCEWVLPNFLCVIPDWAYFKEFNALPYDSKTKIQFCTDVRRWAPLRHKFLDRLLDSLYFEFV